jgi:hypothetical protein
MKARLERLKSAGKGLEGEDVWALVDLIPGPDMTLGDRGVFEGRVRADQATSDKFKVEASDTVLSARRQLKAIAEEMRGSLHSPVLKA